MIAKRVVLAVRAVAFLLMASGRAGAADCQQFDSARSAAYLPYIGLVQDEINAIPQGTAFNAGIADLSSKYVQGVRVGDLKALRQLIGISLFSAIAAKKEPLDVIFKLTCALAKKPLPPANVADPLACAVIALDGARRDSLMNRSLAREMLDVAKTNLSTDADRAGAQYLFNAVAPIALICAS